MSRVTSWAAAVAAVVLLNLPLAMANRWPTPFPRLTGDLSAELAAVLLVLAAASRAAPGPGVRTIRGLAVLWVFLTYGRYAASTAQSLWGRDVNLYWDMPHLPAVGAMLAYVIDPRVVAGLLAGLILVPLLLYVPYRWAFATLVRAMRDTDRRRVLAGAAAALLAYGAGQQLDARVPRRPAVVEPVTLVWARQARQFAIEASGAGVHALGPAPVIDATLDGLGGADVFLVFVESYGAVSWDRPAFAAALAPARARFEADIHDTGRDVVSAFVESPTFGGESWLAHISLLSGTEVKDGATNVRLLAQDRDTMVTAFARAGYRTIAIMPGLQHAWREGAFYGFDVVYDAPRLAYAGPPFGWWDVTDQFALAKVDRQEVAGRHAPVFVVFPTISTHTPFTPTPPYQADWARVLTSSPYDEQALDAAWSVQADWLDLGPGFVQALDYDFQTLGGYLRLRADRDIVLIVLGDHQPPALVSGEGAPWDVPVHVVASRPGLLDALVARGFRRGLTPARPLLSKMHALLPTLLDAFDGRAASPR
ncbi:MAG: sulfatase-like hydrolase/transferase [Vicinamibacterales bacterium]